MLKQSLISHLLFLPRNASPAKKKYFSNRLLNSFILKTEEQLLVLDGPMGNILKELHSEKQRPRDRRVHNYLRTQTH